MHQQPRPQQRHQLHICSCMHICSYVCARAHWCTARRSAGAACMARSARWQLEGWSFQLDQQDHRQGSIPSIPEPTLSAAVWACRRTPAFLLFGLEWGPILPWDKRQAVPGPPPLFLVSPGSPPRFHDGHSFHARSFPPPLLLARQSAPRRLCIAVGEATQCLTSQ
eukprot:365942-Chlamydomonas_euryale.AAC.72